MPKIITDPTLPTDPADRKRELTRRRSERLRARRVPAMSHVEKIAAGLIDRLDAAELVKLAGLLTAAAPVKSAAAQPAPPYYTPVRVISPTAKESKPQRVMVRMARP